MKKYLLNLILGLFFLFCASAASASRDYLFFSPEMIASHLKAYNAQERAAIDKDLDVVRDICLDAFKQKQDKPIYLATCGAPGSRKTTILERFMKAHFPSYEMVYLDPDQRALKFMVHTYYSQSLCASMTAQQENYLQAVREAYEKWRGASNYIALTLLEEAFSQRKNIAYGTTSTGEHTPNFLSKVKDAGYEIVLLLCSCEDAFRQKAVQYRNEEQKFYQSTPEDAVSKGKAFPQRMDAYFTYADSLYLFWSDDLQSQERLAAVLKDGNLQVMDSDALSHFIYKFEKDRDLLMKEGKQIPSWNELIQIYLKR